MKGKLIVGSALVLMLSAFHCLAAPPDVAPNPLAAIFSEFPAQGVACAPSTAFKTSGIGAYANCYAFCWDGSMVSCSGPSCSAVDSSCPAQEGYCWSSSTGYSYCPALDCGSPYCTTCGTNSWCDQWCGAGLGRCAPNLGCGSKKYCSCIEL
jgi:hypothetical protein